jgi:hypothetical protein
MPQRQSTKPAAPPPEEPQFVFTLARLTIGSLLFGHDLLMQQMRRWEEETTRLLSGQQMPISRRDEPPRGSAIFELRNEIEQLQGRPDLEVRYFLVGLMFDLLNRSSAAGSLFDQANQSFGRLLAPLLALLESAPLLAPLREEFNRMATRGEAEVERLVALGRHETLHSEVLIETASRLSVQGSIDDVVQNPAVVELIQKQSTGLAGDMVDEVRERAVSLDILTERLARLLLRRPQRETLAEPPVELEAPQSGITPRPPEGQGTGA